MILLVEIVTSQSQKASVMLSVNFFNLGNSVEIAEKNNKGGKTINIQIIIIP